MPGTRGISPWVWTFVFAAVGAGGLLALRSYGGPGKVLQQVVPVVPGRLPVSWIRARSVVPGLPVSTDTSTVASPDRDPTVFPSAAPEEGAPLAIAYVSGDGQQAIAGMVLSRPYEVLVTDAHRRGVSGAEVQFDVTSGGGLVTPRVTHTDSLGRATAVWRLGSAPGFQRLRASSRRASIAVTFTAIALAPVPARAPMEGGAAIAEGADAGGEPIFVPLEGSATGGSVACRLSEPGAWVTCRGSNDRGQAMARGASGTRALAAGLFHVCALDASGAAQCWGANDAGQLGAGSHTDRAVPTPVATELRFSMLTAGSAHTCGLTGRGNAVCWGRNVGGQLGDGSREDRSTPAGGTTESFESIVAGWSHTCGVNAMGVAFCWGLNREGQVGDGSHLDRLTPSRVMAGVSDLAAGSAHTCAIAYGRALCWGDNRSGQLGDGTTRPRSTPAPVHGLPTQPVSIVAGAAHTCARLRDGSTRCWGQNVYGQLGDGGTTNAVRPVPVSGGLFFQELSAGGGVTCGVTAPGLEYCWGLNQSGQLGDGTLTNRTTPTPVRE